MYKCITGAGCVTHPHTPGRPCRAGAEWGHHWLQGRQAIRPRLHLLLPLQKQGGKAPTAAWDWVRSWTSGTTLSPSSPQLASIRGASAQAERGA